MAPKKTNQRQYCYYFKTSDCFFIMNSFQAAPSTPNGEQFWKILAIVNVLAGLSQTAYYVIKMIEFFNSGIFHH